MWAKFKGKKMKIALGIEYNESYFGWQRQASVERFKKKLESAVAFVANEECPIFCAGRTGRWCTCYRTGSAF